MADLDLTPLCWNWSPIVQGDTYPAARITETSSDTALARVRVKVKDRLGNELLDLDSDATGITLTTTTAGAWDFTIAAIDTTDLEIGTLEYDLETTDAADVVRTEFKGTWQILKQITD
jgi:hypothetical protein